MSEAIAEVREMQPNGEWTSRGTAFAVSRQLALTAFHVIGDRSQGTVRDRPLKLHFPNDYTSGAKYENEGDAQLDFALLTLDSVLSENFEPIALGVFCISPQKGSIQDHAAKTASVPIRISANARRISYFALNERRFIGPRPVQKSAKRVAERARSSQTVTPHVLRHTFATMALQKRHLAGRRSEDSRP